MTKLAYRFVPAVPQDKVQANRVRREVRSHVARCAFHEESNRTSTSGPRRKRRRQLHLSWSLEILNDISDEEVSRERIARTSPWHTLAGNEMIPASESSVYHEPFVSLVVSNYLEHLAVAIPEVDGDDQSCLLRSRWFPMVISSPLVFQVIVLFSASHFAASTEDLTLAPTLLQLKQTAIQGIIKKLAMSQGQVHDELIAATAKMASYEAIYGEEGAYHAHMKGVERMLQLRGGLQNLGLDGLLARLLVFIDTNSAFLLNTRLHLQGSTFPRQPAFILPNPGRFLGIT